MKKIHHSLVARAHDAVCFYGQLIISMVFKMLKISRIADDVVVKHCTYSHIPHVFMAFFRVCEVREFIM